VLSVDGGNNTYSFGRYFKCKGTQKVILSGYLGSIGFGLPAGMGAWAAVGEQRKIIVVCGDGGFGQYLADFTTAVKYGMDPFIVSGTTKNSEKFQKSNGAENGKSGTHPFTTQILRSLPGFVEEKGPELKKPRN